MPHSALPNLVIAGVVKGGTTSVFTYLSRHPRVSVSSVKEGLYFLKYRYGAPVRPWEDYVALFREWRGERYLLEATPGYFDGGLAVAAGIRNELGPETKVILILRNPTDRLFSFYKYKKSELELSGDITVEEYISLCRSMPLAQKERRENDVYWGLDGGLYARYLPGWIEIFGSSLKVMFFESLQEDRRGFMSEICDWLGLDDSFYADLAMDIENQSLNYRSPGLQNVALTLNRRFETFFRRWPRLKSGLRRIYTMVNGREFEAALPPQSRLELEAFYDESNRDTGRLLSEAGYRDLPEWLGAGKNGGE